MSILKISEGASLALHAMVFVNKRKDSWVSVKEMTKGYKVSANHLAKIVQKLVTGGFLESCRGPKGGFKVAKNRRNTNFLEIYEYIDGEIRHEGCLFRGKACRGAACIMGKINPQMTAEFKKQVKNIRISDF